MFSNIDKFATSAEPGGFFLGVLPISYTDQNLCMTFGNLLGFLLNLLHQELVYKTAMSYGFTFTKILV